MFDVQPRPLLGGDRSDEESGACCSCTHHIYRVGPGMASLGSSEWDLRSRGSTWGQDSFPFLLDFIPPKAKMSWEHSIAIYFNSLSLWSISKPRLWFEQAQLARAGLERSKTYSWSALNSARGSRCTGSSRKECVHSVPHPWSQNVSQEKRRASWRENQQVFIIVCILATACKMPGTEWHV